MSFVDSSDRLSQYYKGILSEFAKVDKLFEKNRPISATHIEHSVQLSSFVTKFWDPIFPSMSKRNVDNICKILTTTNITDIDAMDENEFDDYYKTYCHVWAYARVIGDFATARSKIMEFHTKVMDFHAIDSKIN